MDNYTKVEVSTFDNEDYLTVNETRVSGNKPYKAATIKYSYSVPTDRLLEAIAQNSFSKKLLRLLTNTKSK